MTQTADDVSVVITCFDQGDLLEDAVRSARTQTLRPRHVLVVDDGSRDPRTRRCLEGLRRDGVDVIHQANAGVSAARNTGLRRVDSPFVVFLDGDDRLLPDFVRVTRGMLLADRGMVAASGWMRTCGVLDSLVTPHGGDLSAFLCANSCPADCMVRTADARSAGGYDETMRHGYEDWNFFLTLLETDSRVPGRAPHIAVAPEPLILYRTSPVSSNVLSMSGRLDRLREIMRRHHAAYEDHLEDVVLGLEAASMRRLELWERTVLEIPGAGERSEASAGFLLGPSYGDGGMASAVRIAAELSARARKSA